MASLSALGAETNDWSQSAYVRAIVHDRLLSVPPHPRLFATADDFARIRKAAATNDLFRLGVDRLCFEADQMRRFPLPMYRLEGRRMLTVSHRALSRICALALAYRLTDEIRYANRAIAEAETVCGFKNWNSDHFLDTAEMTLAVALAYDWLFDAMTPRQRTEIRLGLVRHGLAEKNGGPRTGGWVEAKNNWGQVCHASLMAGAVAVADEEPALAEKILVRAIEKLPLSMAAYAPDGGFPEGPGFYWSYATTFGILAIETAERLCGTDFGLASLPGFLATVDYLDCLTGPTGLKFNYSDAGIHPDQMKLIRRDSDPCQWWLAARTGRPDTLVRFEIPAFRTRCADRTPLNPTPRRVFDRLSPLALLWMTPPPSDVRETKAPLCRHLDGRVPVVVQRSDWSPTAWFVGLKGGSPSAPHGHMDAGSFVLDAKGCRWSFDLGSEDYHRMELAGTGLWNSSQNGGRWKIFRLGPESHSILRINGGNQYVKGEAKVSSFVTEPVPVATLDLTTLYPGTTNVVRQGTLMPGGGYVLDDTIQGLSPHAVVRWQMLTPARVKSVEGERLVLSQRGPDGDEETLALTVSDKHAHWEVTPMDAAQGPDESANPGMTRIAFDLLAPEDGTVSFSVKFE